MAAIVTYPTSYTPASMTGAQTAPSQPLISMTDLMNIAGALRKYGPTGAAIAASGVLSGLNDRADQNLINNAADTLGLDVSDPFQQHLATVYAHNAYNWNGSLVGSPFYVDGVSSDIAGRAITLNEIANPGDYGKALAGDEAAAERIRDAIAMAAVAAGQMAQPDDDNVRITRALTASLGACAALACVPTPSKYRGGAHGCTKLPTGDGKDSHHMPADSVTAMPRDMGPAIQMDPADHRMTASYGGTSVYRERQRALVSSGRGMEAFLMDVADVKRIAAMSGDPTKYDAAIAQATAYAVCLQAHGLLR